MLPNSMICTRSVNSGHQEVRGFAILVVVRIERPLTYDSGTNVSEFDSNSLNWTLQLRDDTRGHNCTNTVQGIASQCGLLAPYT